MFTSEIDTHCQINAPESKSWNIFKSEDNSMNHSTATATASHSPLKWLWILPVLVTISTILLATGCLAGTKPEQAAPEFDQRTHTVVIEAARMTAQEKLNFDLEMAQEPVM